MSLSFSEHFAQIMSGAVGGGVVAVVTYWIQSRIRHKDNVKLEEIKSRLETGRGEVESLRDFIVGGNLKRQEIIEQKRFDALDNLRASIIELDKMSLPLGALSVIDIDKVFDQIGYNQKYKDFFASIGAEKITKDNQLNKTTFSDHYLPKDMLDLYQLYRDECGTAILCVGMASEGVDSRDILQKRNREFNAKILRLLPDFKDAVDAGGEYAWVYQAEYTKRALILKIREYIDEKEVKLPDTSDVFSNTMDEISSKIPREMRKE